MTFPRFPGLWQSHLLQNLYFVQNEEQIEAFTFLERLQRRIVLPIGRPLATSSRTGTVQRIVIPVQSVRDKQKHKLTASLISFPPN